jgi:hypothetical protein
MLVYFRNYSWRAILSLSKETTTKLKLKPVWTPPTFRKFRQPSEDGGRSLPVNITARGEEVLITGEAERSDRQNVFLSI